MDPFLSAAIDEARRGLAEGGIPIGQAPVAIRILPAVIVWHEPSSTSCGPATVARSRMSSTLLLPSVSEYRPSSRETSASTLSRSAAQSNSQLGPFQPQGRSTYTRSEARAVGQEGVCTCGSRLAPDIYKQKKKI